MCDKTKTSCGNDLVSVNTENWKTEKNPPKMTQS